MVDWLSSSALVPIDKGTLCRARLVLGWVTVCGRVTSHLGQLNLLPLVGREISTGQSAVMLYGWGVGLKAGRLVPLVDKRDASLTRAIPQR